MQSCADALETLVLGAGLTNYQAVGHGNLAGWLMFIACVSAAAFFIVHRETWRRIVLQAEDPRTMGIFRIVFGILALLNVNSLWELFTYLFTDEGMWTTDVAQQMRAKSQFAGYGDGIGAGEKLGFYSFAAFLEWLKGPNYSLLLFDSSPRFFWIHLAAFELSMVMLIVGWQTKWIKWVAWFLMHSIILRNHIYWEGTENVYRTYLFYLCLSRCERAYSIDNWLRCRRLRKANRLSEPGMAGNGAGLAPCDAYPRGLEAIYQRIPAWPRMLMMLQLAAIYCETGVVKNGPVWRRGDSLYYALSLDHFYRLPPQELTAVLGTNLMRVSAWVTHFFECFFPLVILGLIWRYVLREKIPKLRGPSAWVSNLSLLTLAAAVYGLVLYLYPDHYAPPSGRFPSTQQAQIISAILIPLGLAILVVGYYFARNRPPHVTLRGTRYRLDLDWVSRWFIGRRFFVLVSCIFHAHLVFLMNIGWFNVGTGAVAIIFLSGAETAQILHRVRKYAHRKFGFPAGRYASRSEGPVPPEDAFLPRLARDDIRLPTAVYWSTFGLAVAGVIVQAATMPDLWAGIGNLASDKASINLDAALTANNIQVKWSWFVGCIFALLLTVTLRRNYGDRVQVQLLPIVVIGPCMIAVLAHYDILHMRWSLVWTVAATLLACRQPATDRPTLPERDPNSGRIRQPWAYGPMGRIVAGTIFVYHSMAVAIWLTPDKDSFLLFRPQAREQIERWLLTTQTTQGWRMFAPNPPRSNVFMRTLVTDQNGDVWDMNDDVYACFEEDTGTPEICEYVYPIPWIWYSRQRKINRRVGGGTESRGGWWQKWHARAVCKKWQLDHDGKLPAKVDLVKVWYPIPSPDETWKNGPYDPKTHYNAHKRQQYVHTTNCLKDPTGQLPNYVRERHGIPEVDASKIRPWYKNRCRGWEKHLKEQAKARGEKVDGKDPRFQICRSTRSKRKSEDKKK